MILSLRHLVRILLLVAGSNLAFLIPPAWAALDAPTPATKNAYGDASNEMNGYTLSQFGDFVHNWHFVTVRFRQDTTEMRFTYANDIAWKALLAKSTDYPDGSVFAKIGVVTRQDNAFIDSMVPMGSRRAQFMVRDHARHKTTDGWGYAIFNMSGAVGVAESQKSASEACNACHQAIRDRGMVFSEPMQSLLGDEEKSPEISGKHTEEQSRVPFRTVNATSLPKYVRDQLPPNTATVRQMQGQVPQHVFHGSVFEAVPLIAAEAYRSKMPAVLIGQNGTPEFAALWHGNMPGEKTDKCFIGSHRKGHAILGGHTFTVPDNPPSTRYQFKQIEAYCLPAD